MNPTKFEHVYDCGANLGHVKVRCGGGSSDGWEGEKISFPFVLVMGEDTLLQARLMLRGL